MKRFNFHYGIALFLLALTFSASSSIAQTGSGRVRVDASLGANKDPFAQRAARIAKPITPSPSVKKDPEPARQTPSAPPPDADLIYPLDGSDPIPCVVKSISGKSGIAASSQGGEAVYALTEAAKVELSAPASFAEGDEAFALGVKTGKLFYFESALEKFQESRNASTRRVEKELATARIVESYTALGRDDEAANEFFLLCRLDPYTPYLALAPLRWHERGSLSRGSRTDAKQLAESSAAQWLPAVDNPTKKPNPSARLLAASLLLNSQQYRAEAVDAMQTLASTTPDDDASEGEAEAVRVISLLATAQLWRQTILRKPTEKDLQRWTKTVDLLPGAYRLGPSRMLAEAERALGRDAEAGMRYLRVATLGQTRYSLAEYAAKEAAEALERSGKTNEADQLRADSQTRFSNN